MKKLFVILTFLFSFILPAKADVMPYYVNAINPETIGVYQVENHFMVYKEPTTASKLLLNVFWDANTFNAQNVEPASLFVAFNQHRNLAFLPIIDENDNEDWMEISFSNNGAQQTGWVKKQDDLKFMNWRIFMGTYGRKFGLYYMKNAPDDSKIVYGSTDDDAKQISQVTYPQNIKLTGISGNWVLAIIFDVDRCQKIGWIRWRDTSGKIYLFPDIK